MKLGFIIYSSDPETAWNALRLATCALMNGDKVEVFLLGAGVELETAHSSKFNLRELVAAVRQNGGTIMACGACVEGRGMARYDLCATSQGTECYHLVKDCDKVLTF